MYIIWGVQFNVDDIIFYVQKFYFKWKGDHKSPLQYALSNIDKFQINIIYIYKSLNQEHFDFVPSILLMSYYLEQSVFRF